MNEKDFYPLVSVIVPVYNVEPYLRRCIGSITNQTYDNLEIILVNDGSTDGSGALCDELQKEDDRIVVFHTENNGLSGARNNGLNHVHGDYIVYVDSDDYIGPNHILNLLATAIGANVPMAVTGCTAILQDQITIKSANTKPPIYCLMDAERAITIAVASYREPFAEHAWGKIYSASLAPYLVFPLGKHYEDQYVMYRAMYMAKKVAYENANDYYWMTDRASSISNQHDIRSLDTLEARAEIIQFAKMRNLPKVEATTTAKYFGSIIGYLAYFKLHKKEALVNYTLQLVINSRNQALESPYVETSTKIAYLLSYLPKPIFLKILTATEKRAASQWQ